MIIPGVQGLATLGDAPAPPRGGGPEGLAPGPVYGLQHSETEAGAACFLKRVALADSPCWP